MCGRDSVFRAENRQGGVRARAAGNARSPEEVRPSVSPSRGTAPGPEGVGPRREEEHHPVRSTESPRAEHAGAERCHGDEAAREGSTGEVDRPEELHPGRRWSWRPRQGSRRREPRGAYRPAPVVPSQAEPGSPRAPMSAANSSECVAAPVPEGCGYGIPTRNATKSPSGRTDSADRPSIESASGGASGREARQRAATTPDRHVSRGSPSGGWPSPLHRPGRGRARAASTRPSSAPVHPAVRRVRQRERAARAPSARRGAASVARVR